MRVASGSPKIIRAIIKSTRSSTTPIPNIFDFPTRKCRQNRIQFRATMSPIRIPCAGALMQGQYGRIDPRSCVELTDLACHWRVRNARRARSSTHAAAAAPTATIFSLGVTCLHYDNRCRVRNLSIDRRILSRRLCRVRETHQAVSGMSRRLDTPYRNGCGCA
jgi:hypothetical protein